VINRRGARGHISLKNKCRYISCSYKIYC